MREKILHLQQIAEQLEPDQQLRNSWNRTLFDYADDFINSLPDQKAYHPGDGLGVLDLPLSEKGRSLDVLLQMLRQSVDEPGINPASGGHLGYIPGGGIYPTAMGDYLAAVTNRYAGIFFANPGAVRMENLLIRWMCRLVGYPDTALGNLASGGSIANLIAITAARDWKKVRSKEIENAVIYLTEQVHHCVHKAIRIAGLAEARICYIPMDDQYRMDAKQFRKQVETDLASGNKPFMVVASAGTTDVGAIDPLDAIADVAEAYGLWLHVDAAYGGFFLLLEGMKEQFKGIERSDSVAIDPHKGLFLAYGLGALLMKNVEALHASHYYRANYMQDAETNNMEANPADLSPELTKHFRGLRMWIALQLFGIAPFRACLEEKHLLAKYFHQQVQKIGFEVGPEPDLSVAIYRYIPRTANANEFNQRLLERIRDDGRLFISSTTIDGQFWFRLAVLSFRTRLWHIDLLLELLEKGVRELEEQEEPG